MIFRCGGIADSAIDGIGMSLDIFFQGCHRNCRGCHNPELQDKNGGFDYNTDDIIKHLEKYPGFYQSIVLVGGEPLDQPNQLYSLIKIAKMFNLYTILYTGNDYYHIYSDIRYNCDVIIDQPYDEENKTNGFPASKNQWIYIRGEPVKMNNDYSRSLTEIFKECRPD